ncbi:hypothetical protein [Amaricoccus solimangrovi]|uniref:hypothetical protein n=1 Tax=Amaricoccus solimangrovi TaxID=2589815 RepID=UPI0015E33075|nr:hypothetical protein [Amaricoccus solimangrovi]
MTMRPAELKRMLKAVRDAGETIYAVRTIWRQIDGRDVQEVEIVTRETGREPDDTKVEL